TQVKNTIANSCTTTDCVIACYSAGCARTLLALKDLEAEGRLPTHILWFEAAASAAGGSELAALTTNGAIRLPAQLFGVDLQPIDDDLPPGNMRGNFGFIQNAAMVPMYHVAGARNICVKIKIGGILGGIFFAPVGGIIGGTLFGSAKIKLCGNSVMPGHYGDG